MFLYGDVSEILYSNYIYARADLDQLMKVLTKEEQAARTASQMGVPWVGGFKFLPSELMKVPAGNIQKEGSPTDAEHPLVLAPAKQVRHALLCTIMPSLRCVPGLPCLPCSSGTGPVDQSENKLRGVGPFCDTVQWTASPVCSACVVYVRLCASCHAHLLMPTIVGQQGQHVLDLLKT